MLRFFVLLALAALSCVTASAEQLDDAARAKLRAENKSIVLLHTSMHESNCQLVQARLVQRDGSGRYVQGDLVTLRWGFDAKVPSQITLPPGDYGLVSFRCQNGSWTRSFGAGKQVQTGSILDGSGSIYEPTATFKVGRGEIVDIGSVQMHTSSTGPRRAVFTTVIAPIPPPWLNNLAIANPKLVRDRIVRPMSCRPNPPTPCRS